MSINVITHPLPGERVLDLSPPDAIAAAVAWRKRPNLFAGRALTAPTLESRAQWTAGRIAQRGQAFTAGVLRGFEVDYSIDPPPAADNRARVRLQISPGQGLAQSGEDVVSMRALDVDFWGLPVVAPQQVLDGDGGFASGALQPRVIGDSLREVLDDHPGTLPRVGILVLQPARIERADIDPDDPCDRCACDGNVSYEDWRYADASRLLWYAWPEDWAPLSPLPPMATADDLAMLRNRLAYQVFDAERGLAIDALMPWESFGVAIALVAVDADFQPTFVDRASVVRRGGRSRHECLQLGTAPRLPRLQQAHLQRLLVRLRAAGQPVPSAALVDEHLAPLLRLTTGAPWTAASTGLPVQWQRQLDALLDELGDLGEPAPSMASLVGYFRELLGVMASSVRLPTLWQAQIEQLAEHLNALGEPAPEPAALARHFDKLPPCGLLPRHALDLPTRRSLVFPAGCDLDAVPVPVEQLDLAIRECASMAPLDLVRGERIRILVPVSQASFEPRLLLVEQLDPEFNATLDRFVLARADALANRQHLREKAAVLLTAYHGSAPPVPALGDDPQALEPETLGDWGPPPGLGGHRGERRAGVHEHRFVGATAMLTVTASDRLYSWVYLDPEHPPRALMLEWQNPGATWRAYWGEDLIDRGENDTPSRQRIGDLPATGRWLRLEVPVSRLGNQAIEFQGMGFVQFDGRAAFAGSGKIVDNREVAWFDSQLPASATTEGDEPFKLLGRPALMAPFEPDHGVAPASTSSTTVGVSLTIEKLMAEPLLEQVLSPHERTQLPARGIDGFITYLRTRADRADDLVDYGFVKVHTDMYRIRQLVLGNTEASRLTVSPTLAAIAKAETAVASHERINDFLEKLRKGTGTTPPPTPLAPAQPRTGGSGSFAAAAATPQFDAIGAFAATPATATFREASFSASAISGPIFSGPILSGPILTSPILTGPILNLPTRTLPVRTPPPLVAPTKAFTAYIPSDISNSAPLVGKVNLRTTRIAERLELPKTQEARDYSTSTRHQAVEALVRLADELTAQDSGIVPGLFGDIDVWGLAGDTFLDGLPTTDPPRRKLADFINPTTRGRFLPMLLTPPLRNTGINNQLVSGDEASLFSDSADLSDRTVALFRQVEGRIKRYRDVIALCEIARTALLIDLAALRSREAAVSERLAEARHDVSVTRALIAEELARIAAINERRAKVLENEVRFIAYIRPRATDALANAPSRYLDPGLLEAPVPSCLQAHADLPDELSAILAVVREAPASWFIEGPKLFDRLDRLDLLLQSVRTAQLRTQIAQQRLPLQLQASSLASVGLASAMAKVQVAQRHSVTLARSASLQLDVSRLALASWQSVRAEAVRVVSLGDLIDGEHGQGSVVRNAAAVFDRIAHVCGCLHAGFSTVLPSIRLDWAEAMSQFDETPNLRNLASLMRWPEIDYADRHRLQGLVDWLFDQVDAREPRALELVGELVRMCLLLASHAPVGRIIAGRLPRPVTVRPGVRLPLVALEPSRLRIGMQALVYRGNAVVARAIVEDLGATELSARVIQTATASVDLDEGVRVQFAEATTVSTSTVTVRASTAQAAKARGRVS
ncbi:hypothetical protein [Montanilutibacter psychrotolerans]|uniref:hypothetical protein n=1 Tax=Montanilutibacter psychrotolerans TaxID=1327343 RepID=UPI0016801368|nr:hypothetical protein [Lysobacter psychrotolerans]